MTHEKNTKTQEILAIGDYVFDTARGQLRQSDGELVHMRAQSQQVLAVLAETPGEVVSKDALIDAVWPGIATTDDSLVQCIADIRRTLGRDVIETFPKQGYRLRVDAASGDAVAKGTDKLLWTIAGLVVALVAGLLLIQIFDRTQDEQAIVPPEVSPERTLAVLPFVNLSGNPDLRFFSDGMSEDLTTDLAKVEKLTVISQASSFDFRDAESNFRMIADDLGVHYLVRGTVRHHGDQVRINVSLIDPSDGANLWAERFDLDSRNPFDFQEEVTRQIVQALSLKLGAEDLDVERIEPDAYYMLLRGLEPLRELTARGNLEAREYFQRALELNPEYARAYANIAVTYGRETMFSYGEDVSRDSIEKGLEAAITAIQLDPDIPHAYFALGVLNLALKEYDNALAAARHSIRLDSNYSDGYALLAEIAVHGGDLEEALDAIRRAKLLHPRYPFSYDWIEGHILFQLGRYEEAQPLLENVAASSSDFYRGLVTLAANYGQLKEAEGAAEILAELREKNSEFSLTSEAERPTYRFGDRQERLLAGLRMAGAK